MKKVEIDQVNNGFIIELENCSAVKYPSMELATSSVYTIYSSTMQTFKTKHVFTKWAEASEFLRKHFEKDKDPSHE